MNVPENRSKRLKFLLTEANKLVDGDSSLSKKNGLFTCSNLQRVLNYNTDYTLYSDNTTIAIDNVPFLSMTKKALNDLMLSLVDTFIDSVIDFGVFNKL